MGVSVSQLMRFYRGLRGKSILLISVLLIACSMSLGGVFLFHESASEQEKLMQRGILLTRNLADALELGVFTRNRDELAHRAQETLSQKDVAFVSIFDEKGSLLYSETNVGFEIPPLLLRDRRGPAARSWREVQGGEIARHWDPRSNDEYYLFQFPVLTRPGTVVGEEIGFLPEAGAHSEGKARKIGWMVLGLSTRTLKADILHLQKAMGLATLIVIGVGILLTFLLVRVVVHPINRLAEATRRMAKGDLDNLLHIGSQDEIGELARSFDQMTIRLRESRAQLEQANLRLEQKVLERTRELEETQSQLVQVEKMSVVGQLVSGVAHELNNPLAGVLGYSQLLLRLPVSEEISRGLRKIQTEAERCRRTVQHLQIFARKSTPRKRLVDINEVLEGVLELREYQLDFEKVRIEQNLQPDLPRTMADAAQLQQVFMNIVQNAQQAMTPNTRDSILSIRSYRTDEEIHVEVGDTGPGIPPHNLKKIFDPFFTTKEVGQGTGLGLSICYGILQEHKGRIWAESQVGKGTTFHVILPAQEVAESSEAESSLGDAAEADDPDGRESHRILVVDDEKSILEILSDVLRLDGYVIETASEGRSALSKLRHDPYDLVISDLRMPGMSGIELYERMKEFDIGLCRRMIFTTGDVASQESQWFLSQTGNPYLQKPFDLQEVRRLVRRVLAGAADTRPELPWVNPFSPHDPDPFA